MIQVGTKELKNRLSHYLRLVREGEHVVVTDRGRPVAELHGFDGQARTTSSALLRLAARGEATLPTKPGPPPPVEPLRIPGVSLSDAVLENRDDDAERF